MLNFNIMKIFIFLYFHEHKNSQINYFNPIFKSINFRVLQLDEKEGDEKKSNNCVLGY